MALPPCPRSASSADPVPKLGMECLRGRSESADPSQPPSSARSDCRTLEEYRTDPALREALVSLDAVTRHQPNINDFSLENYLSGARVPVAPFPSELSACALDCGRRETSEGTLFDECELPTEGFRSNVATKSTPDMNFFSTDLLLAAARSTRRPRNSSRRASSRGADAKVQATDPVRAPAGPPCAPPGIPRRQGRPRPHSGRPVRSEHCSSAELPLQSAR